MSEAGWVRNLLMDCSPPLRLAPSSALPLCFSSSKFTLGRYISPPPPPPPPAYPPNPPSCGLDSSLRPSLSLSFPSLSFSLCAELSATYAQHAQSFAILRIFVALLFSTCCSRDWSIHRESV